MMAPRTYIDPTAVLLGNYEIKEGVGIWPYAVIRADLERVVIGEGSNVQEHATIHVGKGFPTIIGKNVTIGHGAVINGATIGDNCIIGMNSSLLDGAIIGEECIVGANAVITSGKVIPPRSIVVGVPGKIVKQDDHTIKRTAIESAETYKCLRDEHLDGKYRRQVGP
jgi:carbonic anhydrase/acetyltransferase-like protein (isoleucine patch superfamily)